MNTTTAKCLRCDGRKVVNFGSNRPDMMNRWCFECGGTGVVVVAEITDAARARLYAADAERAACRALAKAFPDVAMMIREAQENAANFAGAVAHHNDHGIAIPAKMAAKASIFARAAEVVTAAIGRRSIFPSELAVLRGADLDMGEIDPEWK